MAEEQDIGELASLSEVHDSDPVKQEELSAAKQVDSSPLQNADSITAAVDRRVADASSLHRESLKLKQKISSRLETKEEMVADTAVYDDYIREDPEAREYIDNLLALIDLYQQQMDNLVPANMILYPTVEQLAEVVDEQQLRHDESFVLEHTTTVVEQMKESFEDTLESVRQSHETANDEMVNRVDRLLERHTRLAENQAQLQDGMTQMAALLQEFADSIDTARTKRIEEKLDGLADDEAADADGEHA